MVFQVTTPYLCAGVITDSEGIIIQAAPILRWTIGKNIKEIRLWKKATGVTRVE